MTRIDPDLIGIWIAPGNPATFEVDAEGSYHIAEPEMPLSFEQGGTVMCWGARRFERQNCEGETPVGHWIDRASGEAWVFQADQTYTVEAAGISDTGIWALRDGGSALWTRERTAQIECDGARLVFHPVGGDGLSYNYTVSDGVWTLLDPQDWTELARYVRPGHLADAG